MRVPAAVLSLLLLATFAPASLHQPAAVPQVPLVSFDRIALSPDDPALKKVGKLRLLGSWELNSNDPRFGGISAMMMNDQSVSAVSDSGYVYRFARPGYAASTTPLNIQPLLDGPGRWSKHSRDLEALSESDGRVWLSLETSRAIWRYHQGSWRGQAGAMPPAMASWPRNGGAEAMLGMPDGRFLVFSERHFLHGRTSEAVLFHGDPSVAGTKTTSFGYEGPPGYRVTDVAMLSDGRLLLLHRRASLIHGLSAKLSVANIPDIEEALTLTSSEIATIEPPLRTSNFEALAITRENGRDTIWVASDDNFSPLLRTLLLKFQLTA